MIEHCKNFSKYKEEVRKRDCRRSLSKVLNHSEYTLVEEVDVEIQRSKCFQNFRMLCAVVSTPHFRALSCMPHHTHPLHIKNTQQCPIIA